MWCKDCRQDVPALPSADQQTLCCPRCGEAVCAGPAAAQPTTAADASDTAAAGRVFMAAEPPPSYDSWELGEQLRDIGRALRTAKPKDRQSEAVYRRESARFDLPHAELPPLHAPAAEKGARHRLPERPGGCFAQTVPGTFSGRGAVPAVATSLALAVGTTGFVCGGILVGWSLIAGRQDLWNVGLPVALVGQIALLAGLVLQLDRLWRDNRESAAKLDNVDDQLHELKATTTLLGTAQGPAATTFYAHFAGGASPQLLLTDLKSQIDLLAMRIAQDGR